MIKDIQQQILQLKKDTDTCILAHCYQTHDIVEIADYVGDSFGLAQKAAQTPAKNVIMCGVRFMAETVKILSPDKKVVLVSPVAGCPMAEQMDKQLITQVKKEYPDYTVVAYINTTAELKTVCDVCVTSSSAVKIVSRIDNDKILFIPDCNLGAYVAEQLPEKTFKLLHGGCPIHARMSKRDVERARSLYPNALLLVHPECVPEVVKEADFVGSTSAIMNFAKQSDKKEFIIGTEISIAEHLQYECPEKSFYPLSKELICPNMKSTTLADLYNAVNGRGGEEIELDSDTIRDAKKCIDKMLEYGG